jgi:hypothetical protein
MTDHDAHAGGHGGHPGHGGTGADDTTGVHGMLLFGEDVVYLSHLPMFMSPHNFQVLLEVGFDDAVHEVLRADREASAPDFDQVLQARLVPGSLTDPAGRPVADQGDQEFELAAPVEIRGRRDTPEDRLAPGESAEGFFFASVGPTGSHGFAARLTVGGEVYLELAELGS